MFLFTCGVISLKNMSHVKVVSSLRTQSRQREREQVSRVYWEINRVQEDEGEEEEAEVSAVRQADENRK